MQEKPKLYVMRILTKVPANLLREVVLTLIPPGTGGMMSGLGTSKYLELKTGVKQCNLEEGTITYVTAQGEIADQRCGSCPVIEKCQTIYRRK